MHKQTPWLQLAVDVLNQDDAMRIAECVYPYFDIVEVGTPLIIEEGLAPVEALKTRYPDKLCLADLKIMDAGYIEASSGFRRGADIVTVLGVADDATIRGAVKAAAEHERWVMADLINVPCPAERARELVSLGIEMLCVHCAFDLADTGADPLAELQEVRPAVTCRLAVAGGLNPETVGPAVAGGADIVVVGGAILRHANPRAAAEMIMATIGGDPNA